MGLAKTTDGKPAATESKVFKINYLSRDFVYLKAGREQGLETGDTLTIRRKDELVAVLVVEFASDYSSSCKIASQKGNIVLGDVALATPRKGPRPSKNPAASDTVASRVRELPRVFVKGDVGKAFARVRGNIAYQAFLEQGYASQKVDLNRQNIRTNIRMSDLPGMQYSLRLDMYASQRTNVYSSSQENQNWDNRVNQFAFGYQNPGGKLSYELGRVIPQNISSIGYIDGGTFKLQATESQYIGGFGGNIPTLLYYQTPIQLQKYGGFYGLDFKAGDNFSLENMAGFGGEYNGSVISREFINLKNSLRLFKNFSLSQTSEIEVNRGWRREKAKSDYALTSMYVNGNWRATKVLSFGVQYDTRQNYYLLYNRSVADSLFDDATRMGLKENVYIRFLPTASIYLGLGHSQLGERDKTPYNYSLGLNVDNLIFKRVYLNAYYTGFEATTNNGFNGSMTLRKSFLNGNDFSLGYGHYEYNYTSGPTSSIKSNWFRTGGTVQLIFKTYMSANYEYSWQDAENGHRGYAELGYWL